MRLRLDGPGFTATLPRLVVFASLGLVECVIWPGAADSTAAKDPLFFSGALLTGSLLFAGILARGHSGILRLPAGTLVSLHVPLFAISAVAYYDPAYTPRALAFGLSCIAFFFAGATFFSLRDDAESLLGFLTGLTMVLCAVGAVQHFFADSLPLDFHDGSGRRVASLLGNAEYFGSYLVLLLPPVVARSLIARHRGKSPLPAYATAVAVTVLIFATQSRSAILGGGASLLVFAVLVSGRGMRRRIVLAAALIASAIAVTIPVMRPDIGARLWAYAGIHRESTIARRFDFWKGGREAFFDSPLLGHGIGSFEKSLFVFRSPDYWKSGSEDVVPHAHNEIIEIAVEYGMPGLLLLAATLTVLITNGIRTGAGEGNRERLVGLAIVAGIAGLAVDGLASVSLRQASVALPAWLLLGLLVSSRTEAPNGESARGPGRGWSAAVILFFCAAGFAVIALYAVHTINAERHMLRGASIADRRSAFVVDEYLGAVRETPFNLQARSALTLAYIDAGRWTEALRSSEEIERLSPRYPKNHMMKAYALLRLAQPGEALVEIRKALAERSHPEEEMIEAAALRALPSRIP